MSIAREVLPTVDAAAPDSARSVTSVPFDLSKLLLDSSQWQPPPGEGKDPLQVTPRPIFDQPVALTISCYANDFAGVGDLGGASGHLRAGYR